MKSEMNEFVQNWNEILPNHPINVDELLKPTPRFFIGALLALLEALDAQTVEIIQFQPFNVQSENSEAFAPLLPLLNLTHAVNYFLLAINSDKGSITMADLTMPLRSSVTWVLRILHNLVMFVQDRRQCIGEGEEHVEQCSLKLVRMSMEKDKLKIEIDNICMEINDLKKRLLHMEKELIDYSQPNAEPEQELNELKSQFENMREDIKGLDSESQTEEMLLKNFDDEISRFKSLLLTEGEQMEILAQRELALKKEKDLTEKIEELQDALWKKEADINVFEEIFNLIDNYQTLWIELKQIFNDMNEMKKSNKSIQVKEKELVQFERESSESAKRFQDLSRFTSEMEKKSEQIESEIAAEIENTMKEESLCTEEYHRKAKRTSEMVSQIQKIQSKSHEYYKMYQNLIDIYTKKIPADYNSIIAGYVAKIEEYTSYLID